MADPQAAGLPGASAGQTQEVGLLDQIVEEGQMDRNGEDGRARGSSTHRACTHQDGQRSTRVIASRSSAAANPAGVPM